MSRHYTETIEATVATIDKNRAMLEAMAEACPATPLQEAVDTMLFDLRKLALELLPAARLADQTDIQEQPA